MSKDMKHCIHVLTQCETVCHLHCATLQVQPLTKQTGWLVKAYLLKHSDEHHLTPLSLFCTSGATYLHNNHFRPSSKWNICHSSTRWCSTLSGKDDLSTSVWTCSVTGCYYTVWVALADCSTLMAHRMQHPLSHPNLASEYIHLVFQPSQPLQLNLHVVSYEFVI